MVLTLCLRAHSCSSVKQVCSDILEQFWHCNSPVSFSFWFICQFYFCQLFIGFSFISVLQYCSFFINDMTSAHCTWHWHVIINYWNYQSVLILSTINYSHSCSAVVSSSVSNQSSHSTSMRTMCHTAVTNWLSANVPGQLVKPPKNIEPAPFRLKSALKVTHPPSKNADFDRFPLITSQHAHNVSTVAISDEHKVNHGLSSEL